MATTLWSCATYYQINHEFNASFAAGDLEEAEALLQESKRLEKGKSRFLYYLNRGTLASMLGKLEESNKFFEQAYLYGEDYQKNYLLEGGAYLINPTIIEYKGEDHEHLLLLYYKALNFLRLGDYEAALVECRRLNNRLNAISDKYHSPKKYRRDAFVQNLMGIVYEVSGDVNNAFIAYRNAVETYQESYGKMFSVKLPEQLKKDLIRCAHGMGFKKEQKKYEELFGLKYKSDWKHNEEVLFFWDNGLGPVKSEEGINFITAESAGIVNFYNEELGLSFDFPIDNNNGDNSLSFADIKVLRVTFPKYMIRPEYYSHASLVIDDKEYPLDMAEDVSKIADYVLKERRHIELGRSLLRLATKKATELSIRNENENIGTAVGLLNALTEKTDTRNWQTLPSSIHYARVPLKVGDNQLEIKLTPKNGEQAVKKSISLMVKKNQKQFYLFRSMESTSL